MQTRAELRLQSPRRRYTCSHNWSLASLCVLGGYSVTCSVTRHPTLLPRRTRKSVSKCGRRCVAAPRGRGFSSPPTALEEHHGYGARHDSEILRDTLALKVFEVVAHLASDIVDAGVIRLVHLCPTGDARPGALAQRIFRDVVGKPRKNAGTLRSRADDAHLAVDDVNELR